MLRYELIIVSLLMLVLSLLLSTLIASSLSRPIYRLNRSARRLAAGDFSVKFDTRGYREIGELADTLNYASEELARTGKLQQEIVANISHDLRTPLTMIGGYAEFMRDFPDEDHTESINVIIEETERLTRLIRDVLDSSRLESGLETLKRSPFNLTISLRDFVSRYNALMEKDGYHIIFDADVDVMVNADEQRLEQVVGNLLNNALTHCGEDKQIIVRQILRGDVVRVEIADNGPALPKTTCRISGSAIITRMRRSVLVRAAAWACLLSRAFWSCMARPMV